MKNITPINIWYNGENKQANKLYAYITHDNMKDSCTFYYELINSNELEPIQHNIDSIILANGNIIMSGTRYDNWDGSNDYAYEFISEQLNLEIIK